MSSCLKAAESDSMLEFISLKSMRIQLQMFQQGKLLLIHSNNDPLLRSAHCQPWAVLLMLCSRLCQLVAALLQPQQRSAVAFHKEGRTWRAFEAHDGRTWRRDDEICLACLSAMKECIETYKSRDYSIGSTLWALWRRTNLIFRRFWKKREGR